MVEITLFQYVMMVLGALSLFILNGFRASMKSMERSVTDLNTNVTILIQNDIHKEQKIDDNKDSIKLLLKDLAVVKEYKHILRNEMTKMQREILEEMDRKVNNKAQ